MGKFCKMTAVCNLLLPTFLEGCFTKFGAITVPRRTEYKSKEDVHIVSDFELRYEQPINEDFIKCAIVRYHSLHGNHFLPHISDETNLKFNSEISLAVVHMTYKGLRTEITTFLYEDKRF